MGLAAGIKQYSMDLFFDWETGPTGYLTNPAGPARS